MTEVKYNLSFLIEILPKYRPFIVPIKKRMHMKTFISRYTLQVSVEQVTASKHSFTILAISFDFSNCLASRWTYLKKCFGYQTFLSFFPTTFIENSFCPDKYLVVGDLKSRVETKQGLHIKRTLFFSTATQIRIRRKISL